MPDAMEPYRFTPGTAPLLVSMPHVGTHLPADIAAPMTEAAHAVPDTDWHVDRLYDFLGELGASVLAGTHSRYVIDLNRPPDDRPLYPGASNTGLCPTTTFADEPIYRDGETPDAAEVERRRAQIWRPYHARLQGELGVIKARHGIALLWEAHSIRSRVPRFFEGRLPDLNLGTADGASADPRLLARVSAAAEAAEGTKQSDLDPATNGRAKITLQTLNSAAGFAKPAHTACGRSFENLLSLAVNGRFKGGYITRAYGDPGAGVHAIQLEQSQITYMDEDPPYAFRADLAAGVRPLLRRFLDTALAWVADAAQT
jgi:N-formylglutamate deformylase